MKGSFRFLSAITLVLHGASLTLRDRSANLYAFVSDVLLVLTSISPLNDDLSFPWRVRLALLRVRAADRKIPRLPGR